METAPLGYVPAANYSVSQTLENANDYWNLAQFAAGLGKDRRCEKNVPLAQSYRNLFDPDAPWTYKSNDSDYPEWKGWFNARIKDSN